MDKKEKAIRYLFFTLFQNEIIIKRYTNLRSLYISANITTKTLVKVFDTHCFHASSDLPDDTMYIVAYAIIEEIMKKKWMYQKFLDIYKQQYPKSFEYADYYADCMLKRVPLSDAFMRFVSEDTVDSAVTYVLISSNEQLEEFNEKAFDKYSGFYDDMVSGTGIKKPYLIIWGDNNYDEEWEKKWKVSKDSFNKILTTFAGADMNTINKGINQLYSMSEKTSYSLDKTSPEFRKIVNCCFKCFQDALIRYGLRGMYFTTDIKYMASFQEVYESFLRGTIYHLFYMHIQQHVPVCPDFEKYNNYYNLWDGYQGEFFEVDFDRLVTDKEFHSSLVTEACMHYNSMAILSIIQAWRRYNCQTFSWDKYLSPSEEAKKQIAELQKDNETLKKKLEGAEKDILKMREQELQKNSMEGLKKNKEEERLNKIIDEKDKELEELRDRLRSEDEFVELLSRTEEEETDEIDVGPLHGKRYLFVGFVDDHLPELKHDFPDSVYMNSHNTNIKNLNVDAVVMLTKFMSHGMYYKAINQFRGKSPIVYCNRKRINSVYRDMYDGLKGED